MPDQTSRLFMDSVCRTPSRPVMPVPRYAGNTDFLAFKEKFELAIKTNGWIYLKAANHLACSLTSETENCLNEVSCAEDLDDYELLSILPKGSD